MARRYATLPSNILKLSADEFQFNLLVLQKSTAEEAKRVNKAGSRRYGK